MFDKLDKLGDIRMKLGHAKSLTEFLGEHFSLDESEPYKLAVRYEMYSDLHHVILSLIVEQCEALDNLSDELYFIAKTIKGATS